MKLRFDSEDLIALAEAMEPVMERVVVRALERNTEPGDEGQGGDASRDVGEARYLTRKEVAKAFGISPRSVDRYERLGKIPRRRQLGRRTVRWLEHEVRASVLAHPEGLGEAPSRRRPAGSEDS